MPLALSYPGVYVQEKESGARAIPAASTSLAVFVGMAGKGPFEVPTQVLGLPAYERQFGATSKGEMADQVRQFFVNGGGEAWIFRTAQNVAPASVVLRNYANTADVVRLTAADPGQAGNLVRAEVDYDTSSPERTFNLTVYRLEQKSDGTFARGDAERHADLSMNPASPRYAPNVLEATSNLARASDPNAALVTNPSVSIGGVLYSSAATAQTAVSNAINNGGITVQVGNNPPVPVVFGAVAGPLTTHIKTQIELALNNAGIAATIGAAISLVVSGRRVLRLIATMGQS